MNDVIVTYTPADGSDGDVPPVEPGWIGASAGTEAIDVHQPTQWSLAGYAEVRTTEIMAEAVPDIVSFGGSTMIVGEIVGPTDGCTVYVYGTRAGETTEQVLATEEAFGEGGMVSFYAQIEGLTKNTALRIHVDGGDDYTPADAYLDVMVRARIVLGASTRSLVRGRPVTFTALVSPTACVGTNVVFEYYYPARRAWRAITTRTLWASAPYAKATAVWRPSRGTWKVRARYVGGKTNAPVTSSVVSIVVR